jgi:protein SCO1/2
MYADLETMQKTARDFKVFYQKVPGKAADSYTLDHTAAGNIAPSFRGRRLRRNQKSIES